MSQRQCFLMWTMAIVSPQPLPPPRSSLWWLIRVISRRDRGIIRSLHDPTCFSSNSGTERFPVLPSPALCRCAVEGKGHKPREDFARTRALGCSPMTALRGCGGGLIRGVWVERLPERVTGGVGWGGHHTVIAGCVRAASLVRPPGGGQRIQRKVSPCTNGSWGNTND